MSVIPEKVRKMNNKEKIAYYIKKLANAGSEVEQKECISVISDLTKGINIGDFFKETGLTGNIKTGKEASTITVNVPDTDQKIVFDIVVPDRNQFVGAQPEAEARPVKSMLTEDEKKELESETGVELPK